MSILLLCSQVKYPYQEFSSVSKIQSAITVYIKKPISWQGAKIHFWNPSPPGSTYNTSWPGEDMTMLQSGCDWYAYSFPAAVQSINIVFNDGAGQQTADLSTSTTAWYENNTWYFSPPAGFCDVNQPPTIELLPSSTTCGVPTDVSINASDPEGSSVTICYTLDGTLPDINNCQQWNGSPSLPLTPFTIRAIAYDEDNTPSEEVSATYSNMEDPPTASVFPMGTDYNPLIEITLEAQDDCDLTPLIYYTTDGSTPTLSSSSGTSPITLYLEESTTTVKFFAYDAAGNSGNIQTETYTYDPNYGCGTINPEKFTWDNATIYFAVTDRFSNGNTSNDLNYSRGTDVVGGFHGGDLKGMTDKISDGYFDSLGVNAIWITPPVEQIHGSVPGYGMDPQFLQHYAYHGYYALDFTELDANMGTRQEFQAFVDTAHQHGIRVVMDVVMNHVGYDTPQDMTEFGWNSCSGWWNTDWIRSDGVTGCTSCGGGDLQSCLAGLPDIKTEATAAVNLPPILLNKWNAVKEAQEIAELDSFFMATGLPRTPVNHIVKWLTDWVREYGVDAFRLDTYKHIELKHWGNLKMQAAASLEQWKNNNPSKKLDDLPFWMVGENFGSGIGKWNDAVNIGKTDALINFNFQGQGGNLSTIDAIYNSYAAETNTDPEWNFISYISSHDTELSDRTKLIQEGTTFLLLPGGIQIFYGDETGRQPGPGPGDQPTRSDMNWGSIDQNILDHWKKLGQFRKKHPSIGAGNHVKLTDSPYTFKRTINNSDFQDEVIIAMGASGATSIDVSSISSWENGTQLRDGYTGQVATVTNGMITFTAHANGVILVENPNPEIRPIVEIFPDEEKIPEGGTLLCLSSRSPDCDPVTTYYSFDPNADENNLNEWMIYTGCLFINFDVTVKAISVNDLTGAQSSAVTRTFNKEITDMTIFYKNTQAYNNVYLYYWNCDPEAPDNQPQPWPGTQMDQYCEDWYSLTIPASSVCNVIFNCGSNQCQTGDLSSTGEYSWYNGSWSTSPPGDFCIDCSEVINDNNSGYGSLREAVSCTVLGDTIRGSLLMTDEVISLLQSIIIDKDIIIEMEEGKNITIDNVLNGHTFNIGHSGSLEIINGNINCIEQCIQVNGGTLILNNTTIESSTPTAQEVIKNLNGGTITIKGSVSVKK